MKKYIWLIFVVVMCAGGPLNLLKVVAIALVPWLLFTWLILKIYDGEWWFRFQRWCYSPPDGYNSELYDKAMDELWQARLEAKAEREAKKEARKRKWHLFWVIRRARKRRNHQTV